MPEAALNHSDKREPCPDCGAKSVHLQRMGVSIYVVCDGDCQDNILGELKIWHDDLWLDGASPIGGKDDG